MNKSDFNYELPQELIAQQPLAERSASRMLVVQQEPARFIDAKVSDLPSWLRAGDLLVFNDTRVLPARLFGQKSTGGRVEILIERVLNKHEARAQIGVSKSPKAGAEITLDDGTKVSVLGRDGEFYLLRFETEEPLEELLIRTGRLPLPPYMTREPEASDKDRYQTVFGRNLGAVAAPTAGLHFDEALIETIKAQGVSIGHVTLHVGAGTFQPMRADEFKDHVMHSEWLKVDEALCEQIRHTRAAGGRVIAVGTTVVRALESSWSEGEVRPFAGDTQLFIYPGKKVHSVDAMVTNFHLPESTLLMLVSAFAGYERIRAAYQHAINEGYRFFSYGDAMLLFPANTVDSLA